MGKSELLKLRSRLSGQQVKATILNKSCTNCIVFRMPLQYDFGLNKQA